MKHTVVNAKCQLLYEFRIGLTCVQVVVRGGFDRIGCLIQCRASFQEHLECLLRTQMARTQPGLLSQFLWAGDWEPAFETQCSSVYHVLLMQ